MSHSTITSLPSLLLALSVLHLCPLAQTPRAVLEGGDPVLGLGLFESAEQLRINRQGNWFALAESDVPTVRDQPIFNGGVVRNGFVSIREGSPLAAPSGALVTAVEGFDIDEEENLFLILGLGGEVEEDVDDEGLYFNAQLLAQRGSPVPFVEYPEGTVWGEFRDVVSVGNGRALLSFALDDPDVFGDANLGLALLTVDEDGELASAELLAKDGDQLEGVPRPIRTLGPGPHSLASDGNGNVLFRLFQTGGQAADGIVALNETALARENLFSTVEGRRYRDLSDSFLDMNATGQFAFTAVLDAPEEGTGSSDQVIVKGQVLGETLATLETFVQKGAVLPVFAPLVLTSVVEGPVLVTDGGDFFWHARTNDSVVGRNEAYMRNGEILVQKGVSRVNNVLVANLRSAENAYAVSRDGRFFLAEVVLDGLGESLIYLDLGKLEVFEPCEPAAARLEVNGGRALPGQVIEFRLEGGQGSGVVPFLLFSANRIGPPGGCGVDIGFGEVLVRPPIVHIEQGPLLPSSVGLVQVELPVDPVLVDTSWFLQALMVDTLDAHPGPDRVLTNGIAMTIGAP